MDDQLMGQGRCADAHVFENTRGQKLSCKYWNSYNQQLRCLVFISHGVGEHSMCYNDMAKTLTEEGCTVFSHDHVGHGESEGTRVHIDDFSFYCDDVVAHVKKIKERHVNLPCFIIGHSMGGTVAIIAALKNPDLFSGVILISPAILADDRNVGSFKIFLARMAGKIWPSMQIGSISPEWLSRDAEICRKYVEDPLVWHGGLKARWACCMLDSMNYIQNNLEKITFPFLLLHGSEDKICQLQGSTLMLEKSSSTDKTLKVYQGAYHQVHHELAETEIEVLRDISKWIISRTSHASTEVYAK
uniref:Monoacylglycerol lipase n=1 Tax=Hirudo verbana TaxID=311461 RepID=A0A2H4Y9J6_9ANNE|nr:monoacylglycerol lipase [Hirudo verbana]